jgi:predicted ATP-grasp superfamily ATP-dependent carboligase
VTSVLVLDAENKNALAAIRSLGRRGFDVVTASRRRLTRGGSSRYSTRHFTHPSPDDEQAFVRRIVGATRALDIDVVLPIGDASTRVMSRHKDAIAARAAIAVADWHAMRVACSKRETLAFAERGGIPVPVTYPDKSAVDRFPVVVKQSLGAGGVRYVNDATELARVDTSDAVIQEYIPGDGYGLFALFDRGRERAIFMHRRVREYPVTGGASTAAESIYDGALRDLGVGLLRDLRWHGVAMVEFKRDRRDAQFKLMEVNPKFWGSLDLSIAAGVDFPWLAVKMALGQLDGDVVSYRVGMRYRWVFDDAMHLAARPRSLPDVIRDARDGVANDLCRDDVRPAFLDAATTVAAIARRGATGRLRRPHGAAGRHDA